MSNNLYDINEDFEGAYKSRLKEFLYLQNANVMDHEVLLMHLGGVIIECYLKHLIIKRFEIKKTASGKKGWYWLNDDNIEKAILHDGQNLNKQTVTDFASVKRPDHSLSDCIRAIPEFNAVLLPETELIEKLENVCNPLNTKSGSFIDLRYRNSKCFENDSAKFHTWLSDFKELLKWIENNKQIIEVVN